MKSYKKIKIELKQYLKNKDASHEPGRKPRSVSEVEVVVDGDQLKVVQDRDPDLGRDDDADEDPDHGDHERRPEGVDLARNACKKYF